MVAAQIPMQDQVTDQFAKRTGLVFQTVMDGTKLFFRLVKSKKLLFAVLPN